MKFRIFLDTNILIYHTFEKFDEKKHRLTKKLLAHLANQKYQTIISSQIIREFYAIATNQKFFDEPLTVREATMKIGEFRKAFTVVGENCLDELSGLCMKYSIKKQKIHDTNIVATMIANKIDTLATFDQKDFVGFDEIRIVELDSLPEFGNE